MCSCTQKALRAEEVEAAIWEFVSRLLKDPDTIRVSMERLIEQERSAYRGDPEQVTRAWADKLAECTQLRSAYQDQQAAGLMTLDELGAKLTQLDAVRRHAESEIAALKGFQSRVEALEEDRDALIESMSEMVPEALDDLTGEERNKIYRMLRLEVTPTAEGYVVTGALRASLHNGMDLLAAQEHYPLPAGLAPEDDAIRKLQLRDTLHMNPLPIPLRTSARRAHRQPP